MWREIGKYAGKKFPARNTTLGAALFSYAETEFSLQSRFHRLRWLPHN
jgi:hypothetical protein